MAVDYLGDNGPDGICIGTSATELVALHGAAPVAQMSVTTAPASTSATNSSPYGYSQAQADAIVTWIRAVDAGLKLKGIIASA